MDVTSSLAAQHYAQAIAKSGSTQSAQTEQPSPVEKAVQSFEDTLKASEKASIAAVQGNAQPHELVRALAETQLAVETAVTVRNRVVEAYQEILRMPI